MKSKILKFMGVFTLAVVLVITIGTVFADEAEDSVEPRTLISTEYEVIDNDYFTADDTLSLSKIIIDGNAFVAGKDVTLSDMKIEGSIAVAGQTVRLENVEVTGDIFIAGQYVSVEKTTAKNIYGAGQDVKLSNNSEVRRDAYLAGASILLNAKADKVSVGTGKLTVEDFAEIRELTGELDEPATISNDAKVEENSLKVIEVKEEVETVKTVSVFTILLNFVKKVIRAIVLAVVVAFVLIKANRIEKIKKYDSNTIILNGFIGFAITALGLIVALIVTFISFTTPIGFTLICAYIVAMILSTATGVVVIVAKLLKDKEANMKNVLLYTLVVSAVVALIRAIPILGGVLGFVLSMVGVGTLFNVIFGKEKELPMNPTKPVDPIQ